MSIVIAVDGTAASGKGTLAKRLAKHFNFAHMDSGVLYRLTAMAVLAANGDPSSEADAIRAARSIDLDKAGDTQIRSDVVGTAASKVAAIPAVRHALHDFQIAFNEHPPGGNGAVMDGRDIGTVIAPHAAAKLYIDAVPEVRAHRRWLELKSMGISRNEAELLAEIVDRDLADRSRPVSPLTQAPDAPLLDTTLLDIDAAFAAALALVQARVENALKARHRG